eukprot:6237959-Alexandrium_andersonii.AAC.1
MVHPALKTCPAHISRITDCRVMGCWAPRKCFQCARQLVAIGFSTQKGAKPTRTRPCRAKFWSRESEALRGRACVWANFDTGR